MNKVMKPITVAAVLVALPMILAGGYAATPASDPIGPDKVVYHVNDTDAQASNALRNISNHLEVNPAAKIVVVTHARGVDFLFNNARDANGNPYAVAVAQLNLRGVRFDVCEITKRNRQLSKDRFIPEATFVPSGVAEITRLQQRDGYAYLRP